jgi:hypothetical protein
MRLRAPRDSRSPSRSRPLLALASLGLVLIALAGCGGGEEGSPSRGEEPAAATQQNGAASGREPQGQGPGEREEGSAEPGASAEPNPQIATERTPGSKVVAPGVPTTTGGDNSIQAFGLEGETDEAAQATADLKAYLQARASGDWESACAAASEEYRSQLEQLIERAKAKQEGAQKPQGCAETLELLFGKAPAQALKAAQVDRILSFRVEKEGYAYLIYEAGEAVKFIAMANEEGAWKVNTIEPSELPEAEGQGTSQ